MDRRLVYSLSNERPIHNVDYNETPRTYQRLQTISSSMFFTFLSLASLDIDYEKQGSKHGKGSYLMKDQLQEEKEREGETSYELERD